MNTSCRHTIKVLSGSALKVLALLSMTADHLIKTVLSGTAFADAHIIQINEKWVTMDYILRAFGRLAFPLFAFLLTEGYRHTRSRTRYALSIAILAFVSEIPFDLWWFGTWFNPQTQNIFFTLLLGLAGLRAVDLYKTCYTKATLLLAMTATLSVLLRPDYGIAGFLLILLLYVINYNSLLKGITAGVLIPSHGFAALSAIPFAMYNGKRGFIKGPILKYTFYVYYPLHLIILHIISQ